MGWGTIVKAEYCLPRITIDDLKCRLEELDEEIEEYKKQLLVMVASDNNIFNKEEFSDKNQYIYRSFEDLMEILEEAIIERERIRLALDDYSELDDYSKLEEY